MSRCYLLLLAAAPREFPSVASRQSEKGRRTATKRNARCQRSYTMPFVDRIIQFLQASKGERIVLESDQPCVIYQPDGTGAPTQDRLNFSQLTTMLGEVMPDEHRFAFA